MKKGNCQTGFTFDCKGQDGCDFRTKHDDNEEWCGENREGICCSEEAQLQSRTAFIKKIPQKRKLLTVWSHENNCEMALTVKRLLTSDSCFTKPFFALIDGVDYMFADFAIYADAEFINNEITFELVISSESENVAVYMDLDSDSRDMLDEGYCHSAQEVCCSHDIDHLKEVYEGLSEV